MAGKWISASVVASIAALVLGCAGAARAAEKPADKTVKKNIWREIEPRIAAASKAGDRKASERELTRLSADDLFQCGQDFCDDCLHGEGERGDPLGGIYAVGFILHVHQQKVGLEGTLRAIGASVGTTDNELWTEASLEWLNSLKRRPIPPSGMHAIAEGALQALPADGGKDRLKVQQALAMQVSDDDIWIRFAPSDRARLRERLQQLSANAKTPELRKSAAAAVRRFDRNEAEYKRELEQCKDPKRKADLRRRLYGPREPR